MKLTHFDYNMRNVPIPGSQTLPQSQTINTFHSTKAGKLGVLCQCSLLFLPKQEDCAREVCEARHSKHLGAWALWLGFFFLSFFWGGGMEGQAAAVSSLLVCLPQLFGS